MSQEQEPNLGNMPHLPQLYTPVKEDRMSGVDGEKTSQDETVYRQGKQRHFEQRKKQLFGFVEGLDRVEMPKMGPDNPFVVSISNPLYPRVMVINAPCIGAREAQDEKCDIFRNALRWAEADKVDAIILSGPVVYFPTEKYGKERPSKVQVVGVHVDADIIEKTYPAHVLRDLGGIEGIRNEGRPLFLTTTAYLEHLIRTFKSLLYSNDDKLLYNGPILVVMGDVEENIAKYYANEKVRAAVFREKENALEHIRRYRRIRSLLQKMKNTSVLEEALSFLEKFRGQFESLGIDISTLSHISAKEIEDLIEEWEEYRNLLVLMGNVEPEFIQDCLPEMISYIASCYQSVAPNVRVVGIGDTYLRIESHLYAVTANKSRNLIRGGLAGTMRDGMYSFVKGHEGVDVVDINLGAGLNPYITGLFVTHRVRAYEKTLDDIRMSHVYQLPTCLDASLYREVVRSMVRTKDDITRLASVSNYESGVVILERGEMSTIPVLRFLPSALLTNRAVFESAETLASTVQGRYQRSRIMYHYKEGCTHYGAQYIARYRSPKDADGRVIKYHYQVCLEMLRNSKAPLLGLANDGDTQHWFNYAVHREGNDEYKSPEELLDAIQQVEQSTKFSKKEREAMLRVLVMENSVLGGVLQPQDQIDGYVDSLKPYLDVFRDIILRSLKCGVAVDGRLGVITYGQGNHNSNTWKKSDVRFDEGRWTRTSLLLALVLAYPELAALFKEAIVAPGFGGLGEARGLFGISPSLGLATSVKSKKLAKRTNAYFYAFYMLHKQGSSKTKDNMKLMVEGYARMGTADQYESGRFSVNTGGDDHMGGVAITRSAFHIKTGCQMFEGPFGRLLRFPEQNIFSAIWGVPVGGPEWGPMVFFPLDFRAVRKYAREPFPLEKQLFANALTADVSD
ncbi:MAG: hypothetical protein G01um101429_923 [Parcubacteria group bacterium Gr01-1014_29]|nr:MAG: hypothetical protein G01um101429_923 [Parcubacteria group bacterium Gr01-1014_29]